MVPVDLARAGEARHFISWRAAVAGLGGGRLGELAIAAEAVLTDVFLSARGGVLEIESEHDGERVRITVRHPELPPGSRRMSGLSGLLEQFLDAHELYPDRAVLEKNLR
ncbi:MAG: hypothetical protein H0V53_11145 [Rubrobacter sp.]|nr:hypothetical protein [Rubrobacter sp.]